MSKEAMNLALEALEHPGNIYHVDCPRNTAITALREALAEQPAQPQQEPVACANGCRGFVKHPSPASKPLTEQQIVDLCDGTLTTWEQVRIAKAIEAAHGIKGDA